MPAGLKHVDPERRPGAAATADRDVSATGDPPKPTRERGAGVRIARTRVFGWEMSMGVFEVAL